MTFKCFCEKREESGGTLIYSWGLDTGLLGFQHHERLSHESLQKVSTFGSLYSSIFVPFLLFSDFASFSFLLALSGGCVG